MSVPFPRRAFLRAAGAAVALPLLDALRPRPAWGGGPARGGAPLRVVFVYVPNGVNRAAWTPSAAGPLASLPPSLEPLAPFAARLRVVTGLAHARANANGDGPGDHARAGATFLTACQARKVGDVHVGVSIDQAIAQRIGGETPFPSLELGCDPAGVAGECDSGYSCAYSTHVSWQSASLPMAKEVDPAALFDRLFTDQGGPGTPQEKALRLRRRRRILDLVLDDARALSSSLGAGDRRKLDEYLDGLAALEARIERAQGGKGAAGAGGGGLPARPGRLPGDLGEHAGLLFELLAFAFRGDLTRTATFMLANEGSNRSYPGVGVPEGHHGISHHGGDPVLRAKLARIDRYHVGLLARFASALDAVPEGDGTLLDHTLIVYGSCIGDGDRHDHEDLPLLLLGAPTPFLRSGERTSFPRATPLANLFASIGAMATGTPILLGDATGPLA